MKRSYFVRLIRNSRQKVMARNIFHMLSPEQLKGSGMSDKRARLVINACPVLVLADEWLEQLYCLQCGCNHWCYVIREDKKQCRVSWATENC